MKLATESPWTYLVLWIRIVFAVHLIYSGLAYVFGGWVPMDMTVGKIGSGTVMNMLNDIGMYPYVKYLETIVGFMLLFNFAVPLALVLELPITLFIFYLNVVVAGEGRHLFTGPQELFLNASLLFAYGGHYVGMLRIKADPWWLWDGFKTTTPPTAGAVSSSIKDQSILWAAVAAMVLLVILGSFMGPDDRILPPRDYVPLVVAALFVVVAMVRNRSAKN